MSRLMVIAALLGAGVIAHAQTTAVTGATVHTLGPDGTLEDATVVFADGRIIAVGTDVDVPRNALVVDAGGKIVTPGLMTPVGRIGLVEVSASAGPVDSVQRGDRFTASFDVADAFNPRSTLVAVNRIEGITRAVITPDAAGPDPAGGTSHLIAGLAAVVNLGGDRDSIDRRNAAMIAYAGESGAALAGESRAQALLLLRDALAEAADYRNDGDAWERGQHRDYALSQPDLEALQGVLSGDIPLLVYVDRASDILTLIDLADDFNVRLIIASGVEAWMVADDIAAAGIPVILAPEANLPSNFDRLNASEANAPTLVAAGVTIAFADGSATSHNARNITQSAGNAVVQGLTTDQALRAMTLSPAEIFGVDDRIGSIEPGKEADLVIWPGDPLELANYPEMVYIRGVAVPMESRQTLLRDRYRDVTDSTPPAYRD